MATVSRAKIRRNVLLNLAGYGLPLAAALVAVPVLLHGLGPDRFGVVALALTLVTVVGVLDLGFGRAMTQAVAARLGRGEESRTGALVGTAAAVTAALGILLAVVAVVSRFLQSDLHDAAHRIPGNNFVIQCYQFAVIHINRPFFMHPAQ